MLEEPTYEELKKRVKDLEQAEFEYKQKEMVSTQNQLNSILRVAPIGIGLVVDRKIKFVNDRFVEMVGYSKKELIESSSRSLYPSDEEFERVGKYKYEQIKEKGTGSIETVLQKKDGSLMDVFLSSTPLNLQDLSQGVTFTALDITERKQAEAAIAKSESQWRKTFNSINDVVTLQDTKLRIIKANQAACTCLDHPCNAIVSSHCYELFRGENKPCNDCPLLETKKTFEPYTREMHHGKIGKTFLVSAAPVFNTQGELEFIAHVAKDITETKKLEEDRVRLTTAIDQASETVVVTDLQGRIQYVNPAFIKTTGYTREEAIGQFADFIRSDNQDQAFFEKMSRTLEQGEVWSGHFINKKKDGSLFEEEATISPVKNNDGDITNFVAVKRDVSREMSLEKQLRQAMKMEAIGTLAGGIAHDFNNILSAILGYSEMAKARLSAADDSIRKDLEQVIKAGARATELVKQILTFSRQGEEDFKPLKVQLILKEVLKLLRASLPTSVQLKESINTNCGSILADSTQIHQVLMNLCTNAKHSLDQETGVLAITLSEIEVTEETNIKDVPQIIPGKYLDLEISDTGCGMDGLTRAKIFDPFFTTKEKGKGTGLGLAVVHGIVKQHKGEIAVSSVPGQGTTFHIYLPIIDEEVLDEHPLNEDAPQGNGERILFVDDETVIARMMERMLKSLGYNVTIFTSSVEACNAYQKDPNSFNLVISDMAMPEMTGIELTKKILTLRPNLPVILCTGYSETLDEAVAKSLGVFEYVRKPVEKVTLAKTIRSALNANLNC